MATETAPTRDRARGHKTRYVIKLLSQQAKAKLTDHLLAKAILAEYPDSESNWLTRLPALRRIYNEGKLPGQEKRPAVPVKKYDANSGTGTIVKAKAKA